jgi:ribosomal protein S18 acetylase RimI-like enzyme
VISLRPFDRDDLDALYRVCLDTGDGGRGAAALHDDPKLLGHAYAAPYAILQPDLAFVVEDDEGVAGYVLGALDSTVFEDLLEAEWWPKLRIDYPVPPAGGPWNADQRVANHIHHPVRTPVELVAEFPSHLHINLLPRLQGKGVGGTLLQLELDALRAGGSSGVHLHVRRHNERALGFYRHLGFVELESPGEKLVFGMRFVL